MEEIPITSTSFGTSESQIGFVPLQRFSAKVFQSVLLTEDPAATNGSQDRGPGRDSLGTLITSLGHFDIPRSEFGITPLARECSYLREESTSIGIPGVESCKHPIDYRKRPSGCLVNLDASSRAHIDLVHGKRASLAVSDVSDLQDEDLEDLSKLVGHEDAP